MRSPPLSTFPASLAAPRPTAVTRLVAPRRRWEGLAVGRRRVIACHRKPLAVEDRGFAVPLVLGQHRADPGGGAGVVQGACHQPKLHAEPIGAFLDDDDRAQRRQRRVRPRFQQPAPERAQARNRIGGAEIDAELGALDCNLRGGFLVRLGVADGRGRHHLRDRARRHRAERLGRVRSALRRPDRAAP